MPHRAAGDRPAAKWLVVDLPAAPCLAKKFPVGGGPVSILTFHGVGEPRRPIAADERAVWLSVDEFRRILDLVATRSDVRLTFDDGNVSDYDVVLPELDRRGRVGWFFVPAARVGAPGCLDASQVRGLVDAGMVVGSHGMRHRPWAGLAGEALREEVVESRDALEQIAGAQVDEAACPFGSYDRRALAALRRAGFARVYTSDRGPSRPSQWLQARTTVHAGDDQAAIERMLVPELGAVATFARSARLFVKRWR